MIFKEIMKYEIKKIKNILYSNIFNKYDIEEFFKNNMAVDFAYIREIEKYVNEKYNNEINLYLELAKCYLNTNINMSIKYLEKYKSNGGNNQDALMLLVKLYRNIGSFKKAVKIIKNIKFNNDREKIEEIFRTYMQLNPESAEFRRHLKKIIVAVDKYAGKDRKKLIRFVLVKIFKKIRREFCESILPIIFDNFKTLDNINKKIIQKKIIKYYLKLYVNTADTRFMKKALSFSKSNHDSERLSFLFNSSLEFAVREINNGKIENNKIKSLLKTCKISYDILSDFSKTNIINLILSYYKENIPRTVSILCDFMNFYKKFDDKLTKTLSFTLRNNKLTENQKKSIIKVLKVNYQKNINIKYKNIFLNEIEILQKKVILKSKPRALTVSLTTKCNLRCIICNGINHDSKQTYNLDPEFYKFIIKNMRYFEEVIWQGGEVFLYNKFKYFLDLAYKCGVKQRIITNALLLNQDWIEKINKYKVDLQISIDAPYKQIYETIRIGAKYEILLEKLEQLKKYRNINNTTLYSLETVIISKNFNLLEDIVQFAIKYKFNQISFLKYVAFKKDSLTLSGFQLHNVIKNINMLKKKYNNISIQTNIDTYEEEDKNNNVLMKPLNKQNTTKKSDCENLFCVAPWTRIYLDFGQYIRVTCLSKKINVSQYKYNEIWNCKELAEYRDKIKNNDLSICNLLCRNCGEYGEKTKLGVF